MKNSHSEILISPKNWEKKLKSNFNKNWYGYYYFYSPEFPSGKMVKFRGMNRAKSLEEKQDLTKILIRNELELLQGGYNPFSKEMEIAADTVSEITPFVQALEIAKKKVKIAKTTVKNIDDVVKIVSVSAKKLGIANTRISEIKKRDIRLILDDVVERGYSNDRYNKVRAYLGIIWNYLIDLEIFEHNFIYSIDKLPHTPKIRVILSDEDKIQFEKLKGLNYNLWRFCKMFYYSGSRITEFTNIKISDVNFQRQEFKIFEKKGRQYHEVIKPMNLTVSYLWKEIISEATSENDFIFGNSLAPHQSHISKDALYHRWLRWGQKKLGIMVDLYAFRHTYANDVTKLHGIKKAQGLLGHKNEKTTMIYAVDYKNDILNEQKTINTGF